MNPRQLGVGNGENNDDNDDDGYDTIPLQHKRPFGSGLHKRTINFVPASDGATLKSVDVSSRPEKLQQNVPDIYLSIVLPKKDTTSPTTTSSPSQKTDTATSGNITKDRDKSSSTCPICNLPLSSQVDPSTSIPHEHSFAHQVSLPHSHPPSALDRTRMGLSYLASHGWDPDSRRGLGAAQQGIQFPIKPRVKADTRGVGSRPPKDNEKRPKEREKLLDAGKVRKLAQQEKKKGERIREQLFGDGKLEKYLGQGSLEGNG